MADETQIEEMLECIWMAEEDNGKVERVVLDDKFGHEIADNVLRKMVEKRLINLHDSKVFLTETGRNRAKLIIRRHRLAERLLNDVLEISDDAFERSACQFEHFVNEEITASICTLLGHPTVCPHGKQIPPGDCCLSAKKVLKPVVNPLSELRSGARAKIVYVTTKSHARLDRLSAIGVNPGLELIVHQKRPSIVIQFGETQLALDKDIAKDIFVRTIQS